jgi:myo-inositol-1(or 4)-monophosphatase
MGSPDPDWLAFSRRVAERARDALERLPRSADRAERLGRGEGGDTTLAIDAAAEDIVFDELEALGVGLRAISEERGVVEIAGGGTTRVVIDPVDGSLNAKRSLPPYAISIAVAEGEDMGAVTFGFVGSLADREDWWASRGAGAFHGDTTLEIPAEGRRLEILGVESAHPWLVAASADALAETEADRLRIEGSIALSLCHVAACRFDGMLSLRPARSVDVAAGQLIVVEAGGEVAFPDAGEDARGVSLDLAMRSRVVAAPNPTILGDLLTVTRKVQP